MNKMLIDKLTKNRTLVLFISHLLRHFRQIFQEMFSTIIIIRQCKFFLYQFCNVPLLFLLLLLFSPPCYLIIMQLTG